MPESATARGVHHRMVVAESGTAEPLNVHISGGMRAEGRTAIDPWLPGIV
jgi:hypothetical protein